MAQMLRAIETAEPVPPRRVAARFDAEIEALLLKALAKNSSGRYHSAAELGEDIQRWLHGQPVVAKPMTTRYLLQKLVRRHAYSSVVMLLLALIVLGFLGTYRHLYVQARQQNIALQSHCRV